MTEQHVEPLSERELELVRLLAQGLSNKEIARELYISPNTVKVHLRNIYTKLEVSSRTEATMVALRQGWVRIPDTQEELEPEAGIPSTARDMLQIPQEAAPAQRLATWQQIYLVVALALVGVGLWLIWPRPAKTSGPFTDLRSPAPSWLPGRASRWASLAPMPTARSRLALVSYNTQVYAIGGESPAGVSNAVEIYDTVQDSWSVGPDKPTAVANVSAHVLGAKAYVPGGSLSSGQMSDQLEILDLEQDTWTRGANLPRGLSAYAIATFDGQLYLFGGWDGTAYLTLSLRYDPTTEQWTTLEPMPTARAFAGAGTIGETIYVVGGYDGQNELATCQAYHPRSDAWQDCPAMNAPRGGLNVAVVAGALYAVGGGWNSYLVENEYFSPHDGDPTQGIWHTFSSPRLQEWRNLGMVANETTLYAIGGWDGAYMNVNQAYQVIYRLYVPSASGNEGG
jgi:DNA-binding CsgD family transcriptional regulator/N-acetylneuraminic acid mutarotase